MKTILTGVDFTKSSNNTINYAVMLAEKTKSKVMLFHAIDTPVVHTNSGMFFTTVDYLGKETEENMKAMQAKLSEKHPNVKFEIAVTYVGLKTEIEMLAAKNKIHMVVLGHETKSKLTEFIYGSTSVDLMGKVDCPIITVPEKYKNHELKKMVVAIDIKEAISSGLSKRIHSLAKFLDVEFEFLHVKTNEELAVEKSPNKTLNIITVKADTLEDGIASYARKGKPDLVMMISHNYNVFHSLFMDSNSKKIVSKSHIPVLSIHK